MQHAPFFMLQVTKDISGHGNDLRLEYPPQRRDVTLAHGARSLRTGALEFRNNMAVNKAVQARAAYWFKSHGRPRAWPAACWAVVCSSGYPIVRLMLLLLTRLNATKRSTK